MNFFQELIHGYTRDITSLGSIVINALIILLFYLLGYVAMGNILLIGCILCTLLPTIIRSLYFKERPNHQKYKTFIERLDASSFPSIHAMRAFFLATIFFSFFNNLFATIFFFLLATGVAYSRITLHKHDFIDVFSGAAMGIGLAYLLFFLL